MILNFSLSWILKHREKKVEITARKILFSMKNLTQFWEISTKISPDLLQNLCFVMKITFIRFLRKKYPLMFFYILNRGCVNRNISSLWIFHSDLQVWNMLNKNNKSLRWKRLQWKSNFLCENGQNGQTSRFVVVGKIIFIKVAVITLDCYIPSGKSYELPQRA